MNQQEIEKAAKDSWRKSKNEERDFEADGEYFKNGFIIGANWILDQASIDYFEWMKSRPWINDPANMVWCHEAFVAARLSAEKEIDDLKSKLASPENMELILEYKDRQAMAEEIKNLKFKYDEAVSHIDLLTREFLSKCGMIYYESLCNKIRQKYGLEK